MITIKENSPQAGQPVCNQNERGHKQEENGCTILGVSINFAGNAHQPKKSGSLQKTDERRRLQAPQRQLSTGSPPA